jgi:hypothetical protein
LGERIVKNIVGLVHVASAMIIMIIVVALSPSFLIYDEAYHIGNTKLLIQGSSIWEMLVATTRWQNPGPLYHVLHAQMFPLTNVQAPYIRWLNVSLLMLSIVGLSFCIQSYKFSRPFYRAAAVLSVPLIWVSSGIALTEIPAFTMATFSLLAASLATKKKRSIAVCYMYFIGSGLFAALAIMGRQTYLPSIIVFLLLAMSNRSWRWPAITGFLIAILIPLPVFLITAPFWNPPLIELPGYGISLTHGVLAIAYLSIVVTILAPKYFLLLLNHWKWVAALMLLIILINTTVFQFKYVALTGLVKIFLISEEYYSLVVGSFLIFMSVTFVLATILNVLERYNDKLFVIMAALTILGASTSFGIGSGFSSRYLMTCFPFVLLMVQPFYSPSVWAVVRFSLGGLLGVVILGSYYTWL